MYSLLPLLCLCSAWTKASGASDPNFPFMDYLDSKNLVCLKWGFDNPQGNITFKLAINTTGWVGLGFNSDGEMTGSDIVMGGVGASESYFRDYYATGNKRPLVDNQQSYTLLSLEETAGQTIMTFQRPVQLCNDEDFYITAEPLTLIYAYGTTDDLGYHGGLRGAKKVNLLNHVTRATVTNINYLSATMDNIIVPANRTYYHCKIMKFQNLDLTTPYHIYQIEPVIKNPDLVHHILLYRCPSYVTEPYDRPCYMGDVGDTCFGVVAAWGVGGGVFELPEDVGRSDSSGLRLHYTLLPRKYDAGILTTGMLPHSTLNYNIPPKAPQFHTYGVCNTSLFSQFLNPVPDLQVFAVMLHTHLAGRKIRVGHYRNGEQIDFLALNENYNFELQETLSLGNIKTIKQGDEIMVECTYSTTDRTGVTRMGLSTTDEMCLAFLLYYPAINITTCVSHPNTSMSKDQDTIAAQESFLKDLPQIQYASDENYHFSVDQSGMVRALMETRNVTCPKVNSASRLGTSWIMSSTGILLLMLWITVI